MHLTIAELNRIVGGRLRFGSPPPPDALDLSIPSVSTDSRTLLNGEMFWALRGTRHDGAAFLEHAFARGAAGAVVGGTEVEPPPERFVIQVNDALAALQSLASWRRDQFGGQVVAITGSVGKTTARSMIDCVLGARFCGSSSPRNFNNQFGLPLSMLGMTADHDFAVLELAATAKGQIASLARLCRPHVGVVTSVADAHLGMFGSRHDVGLAKSELLAALPHDGQAVLNGDDPWLRRHAGRAAFGVTWVGRGADCDLAATDVGSRDGRLAFRLESQRFTVPVWGRHHLTAALSAVAVGLLFGMRMDEIALALAGFRSVPMRCQVADADGVRVIDDTYNASPTAMRAALELLRETDAPGKRIVVCGDLGDQGDAAPSWHRRLGEEMVTVCGADLVVACGEHSETVAGAARQAGLSANRAMACRDWEESLPLVRRAAAAGDVVLVKGARAMGMERLVHGIKQSPLRAGVNQSPLRAAVHQSPLRAAVHQSPLRAAA